jgi:hypothetical protein
LVRKPGVGRPLPIQTLPGGFGQQGDPDAFAATLRGVVTAVG